MMSLRQRNRQNAMRLTQRTALPMFMQRGFDEVIVGEIAAEVEMAASTVYRHFETKEAIVLWDEHDAALDKALERELARQAPLAAMRHVFVEELGGRYDADLDFQLERVTYIYATKAVHAAAVQADLRERDELSAGLEYFLSKPNKAAAPLLAGAAMLALDIAFDRWQQLQAATPLGALIAAEFDRLAGLDGIR